MVRIEAPRGKPRGAFFALLAALLSAPGARAELLIRKGDCGWLKDHVVVFLDAKPGLVDAAFVPSFADCTSYENGIYAGWARASDFKKRAPSKKAAPQRVKLLKPTRALRRSGWKSDRPAERDAPDLPHRREGRLGLCFRRYSRAQHCRDLELEARSRMGLHERYSLCAIEHSTGSEQRDRHSPRAQGIRQVVYWRLSLCWSSLYGGRFLLSHRQGSLPARCRLQGSHEGDKSQLTLLGPSAKPLAVELDPGEASTAIADSEARPGAGPRDAREWSPVKTRKPPRASCPRRPF